ncbi:MAG TPA: RNA 2',3'-cyclic phosphodiesterase [Anaerovoracaceae bacterium]|nr:RNA 2',3'-cyclic phosphodiesterase [Anaerovoracaceae bacterium]
MAINLSKETKERLEEISKKIEKQVEKGKFIDPENKHITMIFIGEIKNKDIGLVIDAIEENYFKPFEIEIGDMDRFKRNRGDICYLNVKRNDKLDEINNMLRESLKSKGINFDNKKFKPHITIARDVIWDYENIKKVYNTNLKIKVGQINLMETVSGNNKVKYRVMY